MASALLQSGQSRSRQEVTQVDVLWWLGVLLSVLALALTAWIANG